jgi:hypothetical protein
MLSVLLVVQNTQIYTRKNSVILDIKRDAEQNSVKSNYTQDNIFNLCRTKGT